MRNDKSFNNATKFVTIVLADGRVSTGAVTFAQVRWQSVSGNC